MLHKPGRHWNVRNERSRSDLCVPKINRLAFFFLVHRQTCGLDRRKLVKRENAIEDDFETKSHKYMGEFALKPFTADTTFVSRMITPCQNPELAACHHEPLQWASQSQTLNLKIERSLSTQIPMNPGHQKNRSLRIVMVSSLGVV